MIGGGEYAAPPEFKTLKDSEQRRLLYAKTKELVDLVRSEGIQHLVFMDKSARPLAPLFSKVFRAERNQSEQLPTINFINVGREKIWQIEERFSAGHSGEELVDVIKFIKEQPIGQLIDGEELEALSQKYAYLRTAPPGAEVLIVEETSVSGESGILTKKILESCFPKLKFTFFDFANIDDYSNKLFWDKEGHIHAPWRRSEELNTVNATGVEDESPKHLFSTRLDHETQQNEINASKQLRAELEALVVEQSLPLVSEIKPKIPNDTIAQKQYGVINSLRAKIRQFIPAGVRQRARRWYKNIFG